MLLTLSNACRATPCPSTSREKQSSLPFMCCPLPPSCYFRTVPGSLVPAVACQLCPNRNPAFKTLLILFNVARIKTFLPELPELFKTGSPCCSSAKEAASFICCRAKGETAFEIGKESLKGDAIMATGIVLSLRLILFRIPKMEERRCCLQNHPQQPPRHCRPNPRCCPPNRGCCRSTLFN